MTRKYIYISSCTDSTYFPNSHHPSLSSITPHRSSRLHPVVTYTYACVIWKTDDSPLFRYLLLDFKFFDTRRERHNFYHTDCSYIAYSHTPTPARLARARIKSQLTFFFQITKNLSPSFPGMTSFTPQSHFLSGVFIITFVIVISSAHERELYSMCVGTCTRTKPNSSKPNQTEW